MKTIEISNKVHFWVNVIDIKISKKIWLKIVGGSIAIQSTSFISQFTLSRCVTVATVPPVTRVSDVRTMSTTVKTTSVQTTQPVWTSYRPTDVTVHRDTWENTARRKYPFAQKDMIHVRTEEDAWTTGPTTAANAQSASLALIVPQTWMTVLIICAR